MFKDFKPRLAKRQMRKHDYMAKLMADVDASYPADPKPTLADEALARALDNVFPPRKTHSESWQHTVRIVAVCATIAFVFYCLSK